MAVIDELVAVLGYEIEGEQNLQKFKQGMDGAERQATDVAKRQSSAIKSIGLAAGAATTAAIAVGTKAVINFAGFEREMTRIGITAGATVQETVQAGEAVQKLAKDFALPIDQAVAGLDTLTASGMNLQDAMSFLPSILATAQASGAETTDIANTIQKLSSSMGISAQDAQRAFDIMVAGGKAGQFELKDMAQFIPELSSAFSSLGYDGTDGLKELIAIMQTLREKTGSSGAAATQLSNILGKIYSPQTAKAFDNFGIDIEAELKAARANGEDTIAAFTRLTKEAIDGDLTQLPKLFQDQEFRLGMLSLVNGADSMEKFTAALNNVDGSTMRDLGVVLDDTQAKIDRMGSSFDRFMKALGSGLSTPVGGALDYASNDLDYGEAIRKQLEAEGMGYWARENWMFLHSFDGASKDEKATKGGYKGPMSPERRIPGVPVTPDHIRNLRAGVAASQGTEVATQPNTSMAQLEAMVANMNANLAKMTGQAPVDAVITDARQDNRQFPVTVNTTVNQTVQQATQAPGAAADAVAGAVSKAAAAPARQAAEPATSGW